MTSHWPQARVAHVLQPPQSAARSGRFELALSRHGARTHIGRQYVSYPFHMTRPFALDAAIPSLLTVYQQSSSGGLYRDDRLSTRLDVGAGAAGHVTTQAATVVHDCHGQPARQATEIDLQEGAFLALTPDPLVLFPGAACSNVTQARLAPGAVLLLSDAFASHDPEARNRPFERLEAKVEIRDADGRLLVRDNLDVAGAELAGPASPVGAWKVVSSFMLVGAPDRLPTVDELATLGSSERQVAGITALPNGAGWGVRCLAADAIAARGIAESLFVLAVAAAFGQQPVPRRK
ncbi:urease accessory protein [Aminobacter lissarensis]|uniref:Urease accessory protein UreD n=1 Tax=Aminobacter carboxidus TaxID=376165 RepID=A0A8E1WLS2_9HYPH|nr:urease accessory protein UreD [Aminobacter lissarensis]MBB6469850.1 urease accessory protein [Aminobacter lissarensis]